MNASALVNVMYCRSRCNLQKEYGLLIFLSNTNHLIFLQQTTYPKGPPPQNPILVRLTRNAEPG